MKTILSFLICFFLSGFAKAQQIVRIASPNKSIVLLVHHLDDGGLNYKITYKGKNVVLPSALGFSLSKPELLLKQFSIVKTRDRELSLSQPQLSDKATRNYVMNDKLEILNN